MSSPRLLDNRRFAVRFLGRPWTWIWLLAAGGPAGFAWLLVGLPARGSAAAARSWYLWSGNVLLALFVAVLLFSARKWSIKLRRVRDFGRASPERADACWAEIQDLNRKIRRRAYADEDEILAAAHEIMERFGVRRIQRAELRSVGVGDRTVEFVALVKSEPLGRLEPWLEMHMGLGVVACLGVWLHADFTLWHPVGWTLTSLAMIVLVSGIVGAICFRILPERMARADPGIPYEEAGVAVETYDECLAGVLGTVGEELAAELRDLLRAAESPGELRERNKELVTRLGRAHPEQAAMIRDLVVMAGSRDFLRWSSAPARRLDFLMRLWRYVHVPLSVALFFVIAVHVLQVLWY